MKFILYISEYLVPLLFFTLPALHFFLSGRYSMTLLKVQMQGIENGCRNSPDADWSDDGSRCAARFRIS